MKRDYKAFLTTFTVFAFIISGLFLFGTIDATQIDTSDCEQQFKRECPRRKELPKPNLICPNPRQRCTLDETELGQLRSKGELTCQKECPGDLVSS